MSASLETARLPWGSLYHHSISTKNMFPLSVYANLEIYFQSLLCIFMLFLQFQGFSFSNRQKSDWIVAENSLLNLGFQVVCLSE